MTWSFVWLMLLMKIPLIGMGWLLWCTIRKTGDEPAATSDDDGGSKVDPHQHRHPHEPRPVGPIRPRRGPHAEAPPASPPRIRSVVALSSKVER